MNDPTTIVINLRACKPRSVRDLASVSAAIELIEQQAATILRQRKQLSDLNAKKEAKP